MAILRRRVLDLVLGPTVDDSERARGTKGFRLLERETLDDVM